MPREQCHAAVVPAPLGVFVCACSSTSAGQKRTGRTTPEIRPSLTILREGVDCRRALQKYATRRDSAWHSPITRRTLSTFYKVSAVVPSKTISGLYLRLHLVGTTRANTFRECSRIRANCNAGILVLSSLLLDTIIRSSFQNEGTHRCPCSMTDDFQCTLDTPCSWG